MKYLVLLPVLLLLAACGGSGPPPGPLQLSAPGTALLLGGGQALTLSDAKGNPVNGVVQWNSSNPTVATVNSSGVVAALSVGDTSITASLGSVASNPVQLAVVNPKSGTATLAAPTAQNPSATVQVPVTVYSDYALYQGDIIIPLSAVQSVGSSGVHLQSNPMPASNGKLWPNKTLPYLLDPSLPQEIKDKVAQAASIYQNRAGLSLAQVYNPGGDYVYVTLADPKKPICGDSAVGRQGGQQVIHFAPGCAVHSYLHEFGHALGLWHEQSRNDRDSDITVLYNNIIDNYKYNYDKTPSDLGAPYGSYDYASVMHYTVYNGFSKTDSKGNALPTYQLVNSGAYDSGKIGTINDLSQGDLLALSHLYGNIPPTIQVLTPKQNDSFDIGSPLGANFQAQVSDLEDGSKCCKVTWYSWVEGVLGTTDANNPVLNYTFKKLGVQLITATAEDSQGASNSVNFAISIVDNPVAKILTPTNGQHLYQNSAYTFQAQTYLSNTTLTYTWTSSNSADGSGGNLGTGAQLGVTFGSTGPRTVTLTVKDNYGATATASVNVVVDPPPPVPTIVQISVNKTNLLDGSGNLLPQFDPFQVYLNSSLNLSGTASGGSGALQYRWTWQYTDKTGCPEIQIGTGATPTWVANYDKNNCVDFGQGNLTLYVSDASNQTASKSVHIRFIDVPH